MKPGEMGHTPGVYREYSRRYSRNARLYNSENPMKRARIALPILLGVIVALWGCTTPSTSTEARTLEARVGKLEKDLKLSQDQAKQEQARAVELERDRDGAKLALKQRSDELTKNVGELEGVRKDLKALLGRVDVALGATPAKPTSEISLTLPTISAK